MQIKKAVITAAGRGVRLYPVADTVQKAMLPLIDRDGLAKPVIQIIAEEALDSGIEELCIVCAPEDEARYRTQLGMLRENMLRAYGGVDWALAQAERLDTLLRRIQFAPQHEPLGYGHAVYCAKDFVGGEAFLLLLSDHLYISDIHGKRCAQQLIELAAREECAVAAVQATREHLVGRYGTVAGRRVPDATGIYQIERTLEKPSVSTAELQLQTPGLRTGHYLCFFGMHVLCNSLFDILGHTISDAKGGDIQLTPALNELAQREKYLALEVGGRRYDIGARYGLFQAQTALALAGKDSNEVLTTVIEVLAEARQSHWMEAER